MNAYFCQLFLCMVNSAVTSKVQWIYNTEKITFLSTKRDSGLKFHSIRFIPYADMISGIFRGSEYGMEDSWGKRGSDFTTSRIVFDGVSMTYGELIPRSGNAMANLRSKFHNLSNPLFNRYNKRSGLWINNWLRSPVFEHQHMRERSTSAYDRMWMWFYVIVRTGRDLHTDGKKRRLGLFGSDHMVSIFILNACTIHRKNKELIEQICPNICRSKPCGSINNVATPKCFALKKGLFVSNYQCRCKSNHKWSKWQYTCVVFNPCSRPNTCFKEGTKNCVYHTEKNVAICECKETHMGSRCQTQRNPCLERLNPINLIGKRACAVSRGNNCIPKLGTDVYKCECRDQWIHDFGLNYPNCLAFRDLCSQVLCIRGDCVSSLNGREAKCVCPFGYTGKFCERQQSNWATWSPWTGCDPRCGTARRSLRKRWCNGDHCEGANHQVRMCGPDYCGEHPIFAAFGPTRWKLARYFGILMQWFVIIIITFAMCTWGLMIILVMFPGFGANLVMLSRK